MFFNLDVTLPSGVLIKYWVIEAISINTKANSLNCQLSAYISQEAHDGGKTPAFTYSSDTTIDQTQSDVQKAFLIILNKIQTVVTDQLVTTATPKAEGI